jgi:hypothetical protein
MTRKKGAQNNKKGAQNDVAWYDRNLRNGTQEFAAPRSLPHYE